MSRSMYRGLLWLLALLFAASFSAVVLPSYLAEQPGLFAAFAAGFVNPYASGYALDAILCWWVLAVWVAHDAHAHGIRRGWIALLLGIVPGVATGFAVYLLMRSKQMETRDV